MIGKLLRKSISAARQSLLRKGVLLFIRSLRRIKRILRRRRKHLNRMLWRRRKHFERRVQRWVKIAHRQYVFWREMQRFEAAKNPELMRNILQGSLRPLDGKTYQIQDCQVHSIRYRRAEHWRLQYELRLLEPDTGRERALWVTGWIYPGDQTTRKYERLRSEPEREIPAPSLTFSPFSYIPDLRMLVQVFPYDRKLHPALPLLMAEPLPELEPLLLAQFEPGDWQAEVWESEPVGYVFENRATLRLTVRAQEATTGQKEEKRFYAKVYKDAEKGRQTYEVLQALWDKASVGSLCFDVGRPVAYLSSLRTLIQEETPGTTLYEILLLGEDEATQALRKFATSLAALHLNSVTIPRRHSLQNELNVLRTYERHLQQACPSLRPEIEEIVDTIVTELEEVTPAPTHGDLHAQNVLVDGDRVALIDFDDFAAGDPVRDVAKVLALLSNAATIKWPPLSHDRAQRAARTFAQEYFTHVSEAWRARLSFHYACSLLILAGYLSEGGYLSENQRPSWEPDQIETLIKDAKQALAGRVW